MSLPVLINSVQNYLNSNSMFVDPDWLTDCVSYLLENYSNEQEIKIQAKEQWLLNNLMDICPGCLPDNIKKIHKIVLPRRYVLQINAAVDIGTPAYQQYLKLQKVNTENIEATIKFEEKVPSHRMIKLYMTDGKQEITGIEYKPMRNLSLDIRPGSKILIKGPIECRRGVLLLTENSIELLGGEVEDLLIKNSQAGLLSNKLGIPIEQASNLNTTMNVPRNSNIPTLHTQIPTMMDEIPNEPNPFADDEIDIDQLDAIEAEFSGNTIKRASDSDVTNSEKKIKVAESSTIDYDYPNDEDMFFEDEEYLREMEANFDAKENELYASEVLNIQSHVPDRTPKVTPDPFVYLKQINDLDVEKRIGKVFKVKAQIMKILSKLSVGKEGWSLSCTLVDGTDSLDVDFASDVLSKLVGFTPQEMTKMKKQMATNPDLKETVVLALQKARDNLQILYCIIEIVIMEKPTITQLIPFNSSHVDALNRRLRDKQ